MDENYYRDVNGMNETDEPGEFGKPVNSDKPPFGQELESVESDVSSIASSVFEQYQVRTRAQRRLDELRAAEETGEDAESIKSDISSEETKFNDANKLIQAFDKNTINMDEFEKELNRLYNERGEGEGEDKITHEEFEKFLKELGITSSAPGSTPEKKPPTVQPGDNQLAPENNVGLNQPPPPTTVKADVSVDDIGKELEKMNYKDVNIKIENNKIKVEAKPPAALGGKSKKKQMKPKNKSNKKMKKKQTKKGGKQIKKRSLKRKMKK